MIFICNNTLLFGRYLNMVALSIKELVGMSQDNIKNEIFYGREKEFEIILNAWKKAKNNEPQWVNIIAESGAGKTRLVQELYQRISTLEHDNTNYWPESLPIQDEQLEINPSYKSFKGKSADELASIPWIWWGVRGLKTGMREASEHANAAQTAKKELEPHLASFVYRSASKLFLHNSSKSLSSLAISLIPGASFFSSICDCLFALSDIGSDGSMLEDARNNLNIDIDQRITNTKVDARTTLVKSLMTIISEQSIPEKMVEFLGNNKISPVPLILVLDDVQWFDEDSRLVIKNLIEELGEKKLPLMILSTTWSREWKEGEHSLIDEYELFQGEKEQIDLGGIEKKNAELLLKSHFSGLSKGNVKLIVDRANGNLRYLMELI